MLKSMNKETPLRRVAGKIKVQEEITTDKKRNKNKKPNKPIKKNVKNKGKKSKKGK